MKIQPQMLIDELKKLNSSDQLQMLISKNPTSNEQKNGQKTYNPSKAKLEKLQVPANRILDETYEFITVISPFNFNYFSNKVHLLQAIDWQFPFSKKERLTMNVETKEKVISIGVESILQSFRMKRKWFMNEHIMFEEEFEENKLEYLFKHGKEPILFTEEEYDYLESCLRHILIEGAKHYFFMFKEEETEELTFGLSVKFTFKFWLQVLKRFKYMSKFVMENLHYHFMGKIKENKLTKEEKLEFKEYVLCPITYILQSNLPTVSSLSDNFYGISNRSIKELYDVFKHMNELTTFLKKEDIYTGVYSIITLLNYIEKEMNNVSNITKLIAGNNAQKSEASKQIIEIVENLSQLLKVINDN